MSSKSVLFKSAAKSGLYIGIIAILLFILEYILGIRPVGITLPMLLGLVSIALTLVLLIIFLKNYRKSEGGYLSFGDAFLFCLTAFITSTILSTVFTYLFIAFFDPNYMKDIIEAQKAFMENYLSSRVSEEELQKSLDRIDSQYPSTPLLQALQGMKFGAIGGVIISLILAAIMKKNRPPFAEVQETESN